MSTQLAFFILLVFFAIIIILIDLIIIQKWIHEQNHKRQGLARDYVFNKYFDGQDIKERFRNRFFFDVFIDIENQVQLDAQVREAIILDLMNMRFTKKQYKRLNSFSSITRKEAVFYLSQLNHEKTNDLLKKRFVKEKNESVKFYLAYALIKHIDQSFFEQITNSLMGSSYRYQKWMRILLRNHYNQIHTFIEPLYADMRKEISYLMLEFAKFHLNSKLKDYTLRIFRESILNQDLQKEALKTLAKQYPHLLADDVFFNHPDLWVRKIAILACADSHTENMINRLLSMSSIQELETEVTQAISQIVFDSKKLLLYLIEQFPKQRIRLVQKIIAKVLSQRIDYLILKLKSGGYEYVTHILDLILELHIVEDFIDFMNQNKDQTIEKIYLPLIKKHIALDAYLAEQFQIYLKYDILVKMGLLKKPQPIVQREKAPVEKNKIKWIMTWVIVGVLFFPFMFFILNFKDIISGEVNVFVSLITHLNQYLVIYFMSVNTVYLLLLFLSVRGASERIHLWEMKKDTLLFEHGLLPSISIIAPAYNEEKSIIESITSLLNLKYPTYEVIVVNDGSKDKTIDVLIEHFELERKNPFFKMPINTKPLRGVYVNRQIPNLIVIDKQNGGKADALNLGINAAKYDYVCGIDADSLLEEEALLKLMSTTLDDSKEHIALGGNIVPVNGSIVDQGKIEHMGLGKKGIVRYQTIEYLRAFTTGRIGWSKLNSLLIISGAFGLFQRSTLIKTGGYLTISGELKKDTVGEDMELVVRLTYQALKEKMNYRVSYVHHANCYTELPSDYHSLFKQRNRWQRGLLDILSYHRKILFNPKYKQPGLIAFPYFFIFEMIGPFIEALGYTALLIGLTLGMLNTPILMMLFVATIGYGIIITLFSLWIAERRQKLYSNTETAILIIYGILENFGYRQIMSLHRVISTFSALREKGSWGSQKRQGFVKKG